MWQAQGFFLDNKGQMWVWGDTKRHHMFFDSAKEAVDYCVEINKSMGNKPLDVILCANNDPLFSKFKTFVRREIPSPRYEWIEK